MRRIYLSVTFRNSLLAEAPSSMKLILSRKGFDSSIGWIPSPILPDGRLVSLPITSTHDPYTFADINQPDIDIGAMLAGLSGGMHSRQTAIHLDPDLDRAQESRLPGWRPSLGQTGAAQRHLATHEVGIGDVFIFFGWFREAEPTTTGWRYVKDAPDLHVMFGWLEVADVLPVVRERDQCLAVYPWIANHPHVLSPEVYTDTCNTLYVAAERSRFSRAAPFGGGRFRTYDKNLCLTKKDCSRSKWSLPQWFMPKEGREALSYHNLRSRWVLDGDGRVTLSSAARGQEFVLNVDHHREALQWTSEIIRAAA